MNNKEVATFVCKLTAYYPVHYREIDKKILFETWRDCLDEVTLEEACKSLVKCVKKSKFPPTVNEILEGVNHQYTISNYFDRKFENDDSKYLYYTSEDLKKAGGEDALNECSLSIRNRLRWIETPDEIMEHIKAMTSLIEEAESEKEKYGTSEKLEGELKYYGECINDLWKEYDNSKIICGND